jgi:hypothetical protein
MAARPRGLHAVLDDDDARPAPWVSLRPTSPVSPRVIDIVAETGKGASAGRPTRGRRARLTPWCRLLGHRFRFTADGPTMRWRCERCGAGAAKRYDSPAEAHRYARALDREDRRDLGRRAPLIGLLPLRIARAFRRTQSDSGAGTTSTGRRASRSAPEDTLPSTASPTRDRPSRPTTNRSAS